MHYKDLRREEHRPDCVELLTVAKRCRECRRRFEVRFPLDWVYKRTNNNGSFVWFCSYHCWREDQKRREKPLKGENAVATIQRHAAKRSSHQAPEAVDAMTPEEIEAACMMYRGGFTVKEIAERTGRNYDTIRRKLIKAGLLTKARGRARV